MIWSGAAWVMRVLWLFGVAPGRGASGRLVLCWLVTVVVSDRGEGALTCEAGVGRADVGEPLLACGRPQGGYWHGGVEMALGWAWWVSVYWPGGVRYGGGVSLVCGGRVGQGRARPGGWGVLAGRLVVVVN